MTAAAKPAPATEKSHPVGLAEGREATLLVPPGSGPPIDTPLKQDDTGGLGFGGLATVEQTRTSAPAGRSLEIRPSGACRTAGVLMSQSSRVSSDGAQAGGQPSPTHGKSLGGRSLSRCYRVVPRWLDQARDAVRLRPTADSPLIMTRCLSTSSRASSCSGDPLST